MKNDRYELSDKVDALKNLSREDTGYRMDVTNELVRDLAIVKQGLDRKPNNKNGRQEILDGIRRIKMLQVDAVNVVERSQYLVLLSRIGPYEKNGLDRLLIGRSLFEQRSHENCLIPIEFYPFYKPEIFERRNLPIKNSKLLKLGTNPEGTIERVKKEIEAKGSLSSKDFKEEKHGDGKWWNRKPAKEALEILWKRGYLAVDKRINFRSYYNLTERVIPNKMLKENRTLGEFRRWTVINALDALGIGTSADVSDYYRQKPAEMKMILENLVAEGMAIRVKVHSWSELAYALSKDVKLIRQLKEGKYEFDRTTFLSPFDNLIWNRKRTERLFGMNFKTEMYVPKQERTYGYYLMPILHKNQLIGRFDPKADRKGKRLIVNFIHLERGIEIKKDLATELTKSLREFAEFNGCDVIKIVKTRPSELKQKLEVMMISKRDKSRVKI